MLRGQVKQTIPFSNHNGHNKKLKSEIMAAVGQVLDHGGYILSEEVVEFETRFADLCGVQYAVSVNSGTDALILALHALGIGSGDEVIVPPNSFLASTSCIAHVGARPVFIDVRDDYNLDPHQLEKMITSRTKAIIPVHLTGRSADMNPILEIANKHDLAVIEDCAQAVLAEYHGQRVGSFGEFGCFSLHPYKNLAACGDGGVVTTNSSEHFARLKRLRNHGIQPDNKIVEWGFNSRLDSLQAAVLLVKLQHIEAWTDARREYAVFYQKALKNIAEVQVPTDQLHENPVYQTFIIQAERRDALQEHLASVGVMTGVHYPVPVHLQDAAKPLAYPPKSFPVVERLADSILSLPIYPELTIEQLEYIAENIRAFYHNK
jgi:dTDP-4-amino-4,6-dideoxygalactose transaminase